MARVVPVGPIDPELYAFAKKEAEKAERNPRYAPKNCPAERGQIIYKRIGNAVKAIIRTIGEWGQVNFASSETAFFVANRKPLTTGKFYETRNSPAIYDPDAALGLLNSAIATVRLSGYNPDEFLNLFDDQFSYSDSNGYARESYPFLSLSDHAAYCLVNVMRPEVLSFYPYSRGGFNQFSSESVHVQLDNIDVEYYRQNFIDEEVVPELLRTDRIINGHVLFVVYRNVDDFIWLDYTKSISSTTPGVVDGKCYCSYYETHYADFWVHHPPEYWMRQIVIVERDILAIDGVEHEIGRTTRVEVAQPQPPYTLIEIRNDRTGKTRNSTIMAARCDGGGVYLFKDNFIKDFRAYCTLGNEYGVFSVTEKEDALQLSWCNSQNMEKIYEDVHWLDDAPIVCNFPKFEWEAAPKNMARYGIKTGHSNQIVLFDKFAGKSLDITKMVKKRHASLIDNGAFISQVQGAKWRSFDPGRPVNIITGLIDDNSISGFEYVVNPQKSKDKKITKYIRDNFEVDE